MKSKLYIGKVEQRVRKRFKRLTLHMSECAYDAREEKFNT